MIHKILLPTDGSEYAEKTVQYALEFAKFVGATVVVMHGYNPPFALRKRAALMLEEVRRSLEEEAKALVTETAELFEAAGLTVSALVVEGSPAESILQAAEMEKPDLIVMGAHDGDEGISALVLGSVAERVIAHASIPVLVVK